jgi:3-oxoacyl-[acyl-carrier protein] reductase
MRERRWGRVLNLASTTGKEPDAKMVLSNVTRAGVAAYSKTLATEVARDGVTVNTVLTGGVLTERTETLLREEIAGTGETLHEAVKRVAAVFPVGFIPTPDEFARIVVFLASEEAAFLTGIAIPVDGGLMKGVF